MFEKTVLANGVRLVSADLPEHKSSSCGILINIGGRFENAQNCGISHFIEHLLFKGSKKYSCEKIKTSIEGKGGSLNAFTSEEITCYYAKVLAKDIWRTLEILTSMIKEPLFKNEDIEKERTVIIEEIKMYKDLPQSYVLEILGELMWPKQPLGMNLAGTLESVQAMTRQNICDFQEKFYTRPNITVSVAGPIKHQEAVKNVAQIFSKINMGEKNHFSKSDSKQGSIRTRTFFKDTAQTHIALGYHSLQYDSPLKYILTILNVILGANMSSRLFKRIREKHGLAYAISSHTRFFKDTGAFVIHAGLDNKTVEKAVKLTIEELNKIKEDLVGEPELKRAKDFFTGQFIMGFENTLDNMLWIGDAEATLNRLISQKEVINAVKAVSARSIRDLAQKLFSKENLNLSIIGPIEKDLQNKIEGVLN